MKQFRSLPQKALIKIDLSAKFLLVLERVLERPAHAEGGTENVFATDLEVLAHTTACASFSFCYFLKTSLAGARIYHPSSFNSVFCIVSAVRITRHNSYNIEH